MYFGVNFFLRSSRKRVHLCANQCTVVNEAATVMPIFPAFNVRKLVARLFCLKVAYSSCLSKMAESHLFSEVTGIRLYIFSKLIIYAMEIENSDVSNCKLPLSDNLLGSCMRISVSFNYHQVNHLNPFTASGFLYIIYKSPCLIYMQIMLS